MRTVSQNPSLNGRGRSVTIWLVAAALVVGGVYGYMAMRPVDAPPSPLPTGQSLPRPEPAERLPLAPRQLFDTSGFMFAEPQGMWEPNASLDEVRAAWIQWNERLSIDLERSQSQVANDPAALSQLVGVRASHLMSQGKAVEAYDVLTLGRESVERAGGPLRQAMLGNMIYFQGVASLRRGENDNCVMCRGDSSCIFPISPTAVHKNDAGSRQAVVHFEEYLEHHPNDLGVKWLLNLAHATLGEYPDKVDPRHRLKLDPFLKPEFDIGRFRDVGHLVGCNRFNQSGGVILDDFDSDGLFDLVVTSSEASQCVDIYRNDGQGQFRICTSEAGVKNQLGGLNCVQADYNNDGRLDIYIPRGAWLNTPIRPSLLRNDGNLQFTDVTAEAGLLHAHNSNAAQWADYDNDGWLDLFVCCEKQPHRLYRNLGDGRFEDQASKAGLLSDGQRFGKGCAWIDFDNDDYPDLYVNYLGGVGQLYHNDRDGTFSNASAALAGGGAQNGFSCWCWDFNNDGWQDILATSFERSLEDVVRGLIGEPHQMPSNKLFLNLEGRGFRDVTREAGLDLVFSAMGSNFADFNNDGLLDFYLGTGDPDFGMLVPNRMFLNVHGERFSEITVSAGVGHLQKGHGVACADWNRDGNIDMFVQTGGAVPGDKFHNCLFQNPGHEHPWISIRLEGVKTNRCAIGARIKVVTSGTAAQTIHRHVSSGSSFGGNPLEQHIGLGDAVGIERIEIYWPTSRTTQIFHNPSVRQVLNIREFDDEFKVVTPAAIPVPPPDAAAPAMQSST